jgi:spermidine synthase
VQLASKTNFNEFNQGIFDGEDKRVKVHLMDGVNFMLRTDEMFDLIQVDSFTVEHLASSDFFTRDFYQICEKHLSSDGIILQWVTTTRRPEALVKNLLATFRSVFPFATVWSSPSGHIYFIGSKEKDSLKSPDNFRNWLTTFLTKKSHRDVIQKINIERLSPVRILSVDEVNKYLEDYHKSLNTHDKPIYATSFQSGQSIEEAFHLN